MPSPLVHFAIPIRNVGPWLDEALRSLHAQTERRWTATLVDDDSDDDTGRVAQDWVNKDPRMSLIQRGRVGLVGALNLALERHGGAPFIARFDGDDICRPERLAKQLSFLSEHSDVDVLDSRFALDQDDEQAHGGMLRYRKWHDSIESHADFEREFLVENPICHPCSIFKTSVLARLPQDGPPYREGDFPEDYDLWLRLYRAGARFHKLPERLVVWRDRPSRATRNDPVYRRDAFFSLKWSHLREQLDLGSERIAVWGAKRGGKPWIRALAQAGCPPIAVVDIDPKAVGNSRQGVPIVAPEGLEALRPDRVLIAVGSVGARTLIETHLQELNLPSIAVVGLA